MSVHSIAEASNSLSRLVAKARAGETVVLTRHGKEVARIVGTEPPTPKRRFTEADAAKLRAFRQSLGPAPMPEEDAGAFVSRMRDEDWK